MKNSGYTIPELVIVAVFLGIVSFFMVSKASYAFATPEDEFKKIELILKKSASVYAEKNKESIIAEKSKYVLANDLIEAGYLADEEKYKGIKMKIDYKEETDSFSVKIIR